MNYLRIKPNQTIEYPYSITKLKLDNPNTSFPDDISNELLLSYGMYTVYNTPVGADYTKDYTEGTPNLIDGQYYQNWIVTDASQQEIDDRLYAQWDAVRYQRNQYLSESDWTQLPDSLLTTEKRQEWVIYRQELRDITLQPDPFNIIWPTKPL